MSGYDEEITIDPQPVSGSITTVEKPTASPTISPKPSDPSITIVPKPY